MASAKQSWARGGTVFAATILLLIGVYQFFVGLAAVVQNNYFVVGPNYTYEINTTAFGWIHMIIGVITAITGFVLFTGATWARMVAIAIVAISAIANFFFIPYNPIWSLLLIALDIFAIWAIANVRTANELDATASAAGMGAGRDPNMTQTGMGTGGMGAPQTGERWPAGNAPADATSGRHWAPEDAKTPDDARTMTGGMSADSAAQAARERAESAARGAHGSGTYTAGQGGVQPPNNPPGSNQ